MCIDSAGREHKLYIQNSLWHCLLSLIFCLIQVFYNKTITIIKMISLVLWIILANYQIWQGSGNTKFIQLVRSVWVAFNLQLMSGVKAVLFSTVPLTCGGGGLVTKSCLTLATPWTVAHQVPLSLGFSRQEYWSGLPFLSPWDLPDPGIEPRSPALQADDLPTELWGKPP